MLTPAAFIIILFYAVFAAAVAFLFFFTPVRLARNLRLMQSVIMNFFCLLRTASSIIENISLCLWSLFFFFNNKKDVKWNYIFWKLPTEVGKVISFWTEWKKKWTCVITSLYVLPPPLDKNPAAHSNVQKAENIQRLRTHSGVYSERVSEWVSKALTWGTGIAVVVRSSWFWSSVVRIGASIVETLLIRRGSCW